MTSLPSIVAFLPFLEGEWPEEAPEGESERDDEANANHVFINMGASGIENVPDSLPEEGEDGDAAAATEEGESEGAAFAARRLSVHNPYDEDWNEVGDADGGGDDDDK